MFMRIKTPVIVLDFFYKRPTTLRDTFSCESVKKILTSKYVKESIIENYRPKFYKILTILCVSLPEHMYQIPIKTAFKYNIAESRFRRFLARSSGNGCVKVPLEKAP